MYTIKNVAFDKVYKKYGVKSLAQLTDAQLADACDMLHESAIWERDKQMRPIKIKRSKTISYLEDQFKFDDYQPWSYASAEQIALLEENEGREVTVKHETGEQTFRFYQDLALGFWDLKPGETREVDYTQSYMMKEFINRPYCNEKLDLVQVFDEDGNRILKNKTVEEFKVEEKTFDKEVEDDFDTYAYKDLREKAKGLKGFKVGLTRNKYIELIRTNSEKKK